jgi:filamentous hemagglutinin
MTRGSATRGRSTPIEIGHEVWSIAAIPVSAPFAVADAMPIEIWQVIAVLLMGV